MAEDKVGKPLSFSHTSSNVANIEKKRKPRSGIRKISTKVSIRMPDAWMLPPLQVTLDACIKAHPMAARNPPCGDGHVVLEALDDTDHVQDFVRLRVLHLAQLHEQVPVAYI